MRPIGVVFTIAVALTVAAWACSDPTSPSNTTTNTTPTVTAVSVSGDAPNIGAASQFTATATLSNSTTQTVTPQATWTSSNTNVATVNSAGLVTGVNAGSADISATYQSVSGLSHLNIIRLTFTVSGTVRDGTTNGVLPNINVSSVDSAGVTKTTRTNGSGGYSIGGVAAGVVAMTFSATGYQTTTQSTTVAAFALVNLSLPRVDTGPSPPPPPPPPPSIAGPSFSTNPSSVAFGTQMVNTTSAPRTITLTNTGSTPQPVSPRMNGWDYADFAFTSDCPSIIAVGASCTFTVTFRPSHTIPPGPCPWPSSPCTEVGVLVVDGIEEEEILVQLTGTGTN